MFKIQKLSFKVYCIYSAVILLGVLFDRITKLLAVEYLMPVGDFPIIKGVFHFTYVENRGAAFGMLSEHRMVFIVFSAVAILALLLYLYLGWLKDNLWSAVGMALIISGGIGNMIERVGQGYVVDFLNFELIDFAVFNVADSFVCVGAGLLILTMLLDIIKEEKEKKNGGH